MLQDKHVTISAVRIFTIGKCVLVQASGGLYSRAAYGGSCISLCYVLAIILNGESALFSVWVTLHYIRHSGCATLEEFEQYAGMLLAVRVCARVLFFLIYIP
jgi:hypothetical protein